MPTISVPVATLDRTQADSQIRSFLKQEASCSTVCFWGIVPGQTSIDEATNIYRHLHRQLSLTLSENNRDYYSNSVDLDDGLGITVILPVENKIIQSIRANIDLINFKGEWYPREWLAYSPETIIKKYGAPSKVEFFVFFPAEPGFPENTAWYEMVLYFDADNLIVQYNNGLTKDGNLIHVCPLKDKFIDGVSIWMGKNPNNPPLKGVPITEATSLTIEQFSELLLQHPNSACFDLQKDKVF
jgi:hypothetical protein